MRVIDWNSWPRREHFVFFQRSRNPCLGLTAPVDVRELVRYREALGPRRPRLTDCLYYAIMRSAHAVAEFRQRLVDLRPVIFDTLDAAFTFIPPGRELHANCVAAYDADFRLFVRHVAAARDEATANPSLTPPGSDGQGFIYMTCLPDVAFTAVTNPWDDPWRDSVPRVAFGKIDAANGTVPIGIEALHGFIDGRHIGLFLQQLAAVLASPETSFPVGP